MANGITTLGGGWDRVPSGTADGNYAETALSQLLSAGGAVDGQAIVDALLALGYGNRFPVYYSGGPYYALGGGPHTYSALNASRAAWDLISDSPPWTLTPGGKLPAVSPPPPSPPPPGRLTDAKAIVGKMADACDTLADLFRNLANLVP